MHVCSIVVNSLRRLRRSRHPLNELRRLPIARSLLHWVDIPVWVRLFGVAWKVRVLLISNATYFLIPGGPEPEIVALFKALNRVFEIHRFWDVGANVGYYGWLVASLNPAAEVCMFEPDPRNVALLQRTKARAALGRVQVRAEAVSETAGRAVFELDEEYGHKGSVRGPANVTVVSKNGTPTVTVLTTTLDELRSEVGQVELIKIDVEGHEESVLRGAKKTLGEDQPIIILECFHPDRPILHVLSAHGYRVFDAERLIETSSETTNYLAIPERHLARIPELVRAIESEEEGLRVRRHGSFREIRVTTRD